MEGATVVNACYGGTAALFNSVAWVESSAWDGRYALVVCGDIAVYAAGPARPSGGCGTVAMLIGPDAVLVLDPAARASTSANQYDFYKPVKGGASEYPEVDGKLSQTCYLAALDECYQRLAAKLAAPRNGAEPCGLSLDAGVDRVVMHSPYNKLVQKGLARLAFMDLRRAAAAGQDPAAKALSAGLEADAAELLAGWCGKPLEESYTCRPLEMAARALAAPAYATKARPSERLSQELGNCYTASLYMNIISLVSSEGAALAGQRVLAYSYGSGYIASMFILRGGDAARLDALRTAIDLPARLAARHKVTPAR